MYGIGNPEVVVMKTRDDVLFFEVAWRRRRRG
jgi:hypothetical protein